MLVLQMASKTSSETHSTRFYARGKVSTFDTLVVSNHTWFHTYVNTRSDGGAVPDWRKRVRRHESATTILNGVRHSVQRSATYGTVTQMLRNGSGTGAYFPDTTIYRGFPEPTKVQLLASTTISDGVAKREATKKYFRKVASVQKSLDGLVFLGELRESLRMLRNPARSLFQSAERDYLRKLGKLKKRDPKNWTRGLSGAWLEWAYGVKPLANDIRDILDGMERFNSAPVQTKIITAVGRQKEDSVGSSHIWSPLNTTLKFTGTQKNYLTQKVKYRAQYIRSTSEIADLSNKRKFAQTFGLVADEFVPTVWNLLPWSFLADYFSNIGDVLEQTFTSLSNIAWVNTTQVDESVAEVQTQLNVPLTKAACTLANWHFFVNAIPGPAARCRFTRRSFSRTYVGPSVSSIYFEIPGSPQKWLNMAALWAYGNSLHPQRKFI